jgi:hypothetical protein
LNFVWRDFLGEKRAAAAIRDLTLPRAFLAVLQEFHNLSRCMTDEGGNDSIVWGH